MRIIIMAISLAIGMFGFAASARVPNDITVLSQRVTFQNKNGDMQRADLRVNFDPRINNGTPFTVCVAPNGPTETACPVFGSASQQCFRVVKPAPHKFKVTLTSNSTVLKRVQNCALRYSIVPEGQQPNYFGNPEIGIAYRLQ